MPTTYNGFSASAAALLMGETSGMAIDFVTAAPSLYIETANGLGDYFGTPFIRDGGRIDFSRAAGSNTSPGTVVDVDGKVKWAPHNFFLNSEQFDASNWVKVESTISANSAVAPDGTTTADKIVESNTASSSTQHYLRQGVTTVAAQYTFSAYVKAAGRTWCSLYTDGAAVGKYFDLSAGLVGNNSGSAPTTSSISAVGNGWYLVSITFTSTAAGVSNYIFTANANGGQAYTGDGSSGILVWGAHLYRSDLGGMQANATAYPYYNSTTAKNLFGYSEDFNNAAWAKPTSTISATKVAAPNGLITGQKFIPNNGEAGATATQAVTLVANTPYTVSFYAKPAEQSTVSLVSNVTGTFRANVFNMTTLTATAGTGWTASIAASTNGWYRCTCTATCDTSASKSFQISNNGTPWTGNGTDGVYVWGAQLSDSASLDPYTANLFAAPTASAYYGPRIDYDPVSIGTPKGLLVEEARTNSLGGSVNYVNPDSTSGFTAFGDAAGTISIVSDATALGAAGLPIGTVLKIDNSAGTTPYYVRVNNALTLSTSTWAMSVYARGSGTFNIDVNTGTWTGTTSPAISSSYQRIVSVGTSNTSSNQFRVSVGAGGVVYVLLFQAEVGAFASSIIPNNGTAVTRNADVARIGVEGFPYSATAGTLVVAGTSVSATRDGKFLSITDGTASGENNCFTLDVIPSSKTRFVVAASGSTQASFTSTASYVPNSIVKIAGAYQQNNFGGTTNGEAITPDTSGNVPSVSVMEIGYHRSGSPVQWINGCIRQITYLPRRATDVELITKTL